MKRIISIVISLTLVSACGDNAVYNSLQDIEQLLETLKTTTRVSGRTTPDKAVLLQITFTVSDN